MGLLAILLGVLAIAGLATVGIVYLMAFALGVASAFDNPARQAFVNEIVGQGLAHQRDRPQQRVVQPRAARRPGARGRARGRCSAAAGSSSSTALSFARHHRRTARDAHVRAATAAPPGRARSSCAQGLAYVRRNADMVLALCARLRRGDVRPELPDDHGAHGPARVRRRRRGVRHHVDRARARRSGRVAARCPPRARAAAARRDLGRGVRLRRDRGRLRADVHLDPAAAPVRGHHGDDVHDLGADLSCRAAARAGYAGASWASTRWSSSAARRSARR